MTGWVILMAIAIYLPSMRGSYLFDDMVSIVESKVVRSARFSALAGIPQRVITTFSYIAQIRLFAPWCIDKQNLPDPYMFRWLNLVIHCLNGIIIREICVGLGYDSFISALAGLIFTIHPLATGAVAYVTGRSVLLGAMFGYLALWATVAGLWWIAPVLLLAAFLSKEDSLPIGLTVCFASWWAGQPYWWLWIAVPAVIGAIYFRRLSIAFRSSHNGNDRMAQNNLNQSFPLGVHVRTWLIEHSWRVPLWIFGLGQNPDPHIRGRWKEVRTIMGVGLALNFVSLALLVPELRFPMAIGALSPVLVYAAIPLPDQVMENRIYFSLFGISLALSTVIGILPLWGAVASILYLGGMAAYRAQAWFNWETLWATAIESGSAKKARPLINLACQYKLTRQWGMAKQYYRAAIRENPYSGVAMFDLADILAQEGSLLAAKELLERSIQNNPEFDQSYSGLGKLYEHFGNKPLAEYFRKEAENIRNGGKPTLIEGAA